MTTAPAMKVLAFIFVATFVVIETTSSNSEKLTEDMQSWIQHCAEELDITQEQLDEYKTMNEPSNDRTLFCLSACVLGEAGMMKEGKLQKDDLIKGFMEFEDFKNDEEKAVMISLSEKCSEEAESKPDKCDVAGHYLNCMHEGLKSAEAE